MVRIFDLFLKRTTGFDGYIENPRLFLKPFPLSKFSDDIWFSNVHVRKNTINYVKYICDEMKEEGIIPHYCKYYNTSLHKPRTSVLTDVGIKDWITAESMGQNDNKFINLSFYRKMDNDDKMTRAKVLADPWLYTQK